MGFCCWVLATGVGEELLESPCQGEEKNHIKKSTSKGIRHNNRKLFSSKTLKINYLSRRTSLYKSCELSLVRNAIN